MMIVYDLQDFPDAPPERVVVLSEQDFNQARRTYENGQFLFDDKICYLVKTDSVDLARKNTSLPGSVKRLPTSLEANTILLLDKTEDNGGVYLPYERAIENTARVQMVRFTELCQALGATKVSWTLSDAESQEAKVQAGVTASVSGYASAKVGAEGHAASKMLEKQMQENTFKNNTHDLEYAKKIMKTGIFQGNEQIQSFYRKACYNIERGGGKMTEVVTLELASEESKSLKAFADVNLPAFETVLSAKFEATKNSSKQLQLSYTVEFD